ncbi:hypothetical protein ACROYT_G004729 [Oculina patagonica]
MMQRWRRLLSIQGLPGKDGRDGRDGRNGVKGAKGDTWCFGGKSGENGAKGEKGEQGLRGNDGINGTKGQKGERGLPGKPQYGAIKFSDTAENCSLHTAGTVRYNSSQNALQLCDGSAWLPLVTAGKGQVANNPGRHCLDILNLDNSMAFVFTGLSARCESDDQELRSRRVELSSSTEWGTSTGRQLVYNVVSSAYWKVVTVLGRLSCKSATYKLKSIGPKIDPCGTPNCMFTEVDI